MARNYVRVADRKPGVQYRPNGTEIRKPTASDLARSIHDGGPQAAPADGGSGEGADDGAGGPEGADFIDPRTATASAPDGGGGAAPERTGGKPKVGRPPAAPASKKAKVQTSLEGIEGILLSIHMMGATLLKVPELMMSDEEAKKLSEAIARVASFYDVGASEKTMAWIHLTVVAGGVYGTRAFAYHLRLKAEAESKKQLAAAPPPRPNLHPFNAAAAV